MAASKIPAFQLDSLEQIDRAVFELFQTMKSAIADVRAIQSQLAALRENPGARPEQHQRLRRELAAHRGRVARLKACMPV